MKLLSGHTTPGLSWTTMLQAMPSLVLTVHGNWTLGTHPLIMTCLNCFFRDVLPLVELDTGASSHKMVVLELWLYRTQIGVSDCEVLCELLKLSHTSTPLYWAKQFIPRQCNQRHHWTQSQQLPERTGYFKLLFYHHECGQLSITT